MKLSPLIYLFLASLIWGIASVILKITLQGINPLNFLTYRFLIASILGFIFIIKRPKIISFGGKASIWVIIYTSLATWISLGFLFLGLNSTSVLNLGMITISTPLLVALGGKMFFNEHITKRQTVGTLIAVLGTIFTVIHPMLFGENETQEFTGNIYLILHMLTDVAAVLTLKKLTRLNVNLLGLTHISFIIGFLGVIPFLFIDNNLNSFLTSVWTLPVNYHFGVWYMAFVSGTLAYYFRAKGQKSISVTKAGLYGYLTPLLTTVFSIIFLGDVLTPIFALGAAITTVGLLLAETKKGTLVEI